MALSSTQLLYISLLCIAVCNVGVNGGSPTDSPTGPTNSYSPMSYPTASGAPGIGDDYCEFPKSLGGRHILWSLDYGLTGHQFDDQEVLLEDGNTAFYCFQGETIDRKFYALLIDPDSQNGMVEQRCAAIHRAVNSILIYSWIPVNGMPTILQDCLTTHVSDDIFEEEQDYLAYFLPYDIETRAPLSEAPYNYRQQCPFLPFHAHAVVYMSMVYGDIAEICPGDQMTLTVKKGKLHFDTCEDMPYVLTKSSKGLSCSESVTMLDVLIDGDNEYVKLAVWASLMVDDDDNLYCMMTIHVEDMYAIAINPSGNTTQCLNQDMDIDQGVVFFMGLVCDPKTTCNSHGICEIEAREEVCKCYSGYSGPNCEEENYCRLTTCNDNGVCVNDVSSHVCICHSGYTGEECEYAIERCPLFDVCSGNGACVEEALNYTCVCKHGYTGWDCAYEIDECWSDPCHNNATCWDKVDGFQCACAPGYYGKYCQFEMATCTCENNATCLVTADQAFYCLCQPGFTGPTCSYDINECRTKQGGCEYICVNEPGGYHCACPADMYLAADGSSCKVSTQVVVEVRVRGTFTLSLADPTSQDYQRLKNQFITRNQDRYCDAEGGCQIEFREGSIIAVITFPTSGALTVKEQSLIADSVRTSLADGVIVNGDLVSVQTARFISPDQTTSVDILDICFLYDQLNTCGGGGDCVALSSEPYCRCITGYSGEFCTSNAINGIDNVDYTITVFVLLALCLVSIAFSMVLVCFNWRFYKELAWMRRSLLRPMGETRGMAAIPRPMRTHVPGQPPLHHGPTPADMERRRPAVGPYHFRPQVTNYYPTQR